MNARICLIFRGKMILDRLISNARFESWQYRVHVGNKNVELRF
jgi:hypothetical protein